MRNDFLHKLNMRKAEESLKAHAEGKASFITETVQDEKPPELPGINKQVSPDV